MEPRLHVITLAVDDLERALTFYRDGLGFRSEGIIGTACSDERTGASGAAGRPSRVVLIDADGPPVGAARTLDELQDR